MPDEKPLIVDASGQPLRTTADPTCPQCGAGPDKRVPSAGFGVPHPICGACGYAWTAERWKTP